MHCGYVYPIIESNALCLKVVCSFRNLRPQWSKGGGIPRPPPHDSGERSSTRASVRRVHVDIQFQPASSGVDMKFEIKTKLQATANNYGDLARTRREIHINHFKLTATVLARLFSGCVWFVTRSFHALMKKIEEGREWRVCKS